MHVICTVNIILYMGDAHSHFIDRFIGFDGVAGDSSQKKLVEIAGIPLSASEL